MIGALNVNGVRAMMTIEGATDGEVFETFLERVLLRKLRSGDIVVDHPDDLGGGLEEHAVPRQPAARTGHRTHGAASRRQAPRSFTCPPTRRT
jgi:hypothetical protein